MNSPPSSDSDRAKTVPSSDNSSTADSFKSTKRPVGLAKKIASRTTDLLAIAILAIAGLTIGRQTLSWWGESPPVVLPDQVDPQVWGKDGLPVTIQFGASPLSLSREVVPGSAQDATERLFDRCRALMPVTHPKSAIPDEAEQRTLKSLESLTPHLEQGSDWKLYGVPGGLTTVVGVRSFANWSPSAAARNGNGKRLPPGKFAEETDAATVPRVVCWGFAFPIGPEQWTVFVFLPAGNTDTAAKIPDIALPIEASRTLALQSGSGQMMLGFQGRGDPSAWMNHFSDQFEKHGWTQRSAWNVTESTWHVSFLQKHHTASKQPVEAEIEVRFYREPARGMLGLITSMGTANEKQETRP